MTINKIFRFILFLLLVAFYYSKGISLAASSNEELSTTARLYLGQLFSPDERKRVNAALKLSNYKSKIVVENLLSALIKERSEIVKRIIIRSLGQISSEEALPLILDLISNEAIGVRVEAMRTAVKYNSSLVVDAVIRQLKDESPLIRQNAVLCLGKAEPYDDRIVNELINALNDISASVRVAACQSLAEKKSNPAMEHLYRVLSEDRSNIVRKSAAIAIGNIPGDNAKDYLLIALRDKSPEVRINAAKSISLHGLNTGVVEAIEAIKSSNSQIRIIACDIIGLSGN
ncbi:HEAT repeat domain-containing protein, partial [Elusimicrobiota bacterium]